MTRDVLHVRAVLDDLCRAAGVSPSDGSDDAARLVLAEVARAGLGGERADPQGCPLSLWLKQTTGIVGELPSPDPSQTVLLLAPEEVLVLGPKPADGARRRDGVPLPAAVRAAVRMGDALVTRAATPLKPKVVRAASKPSAAEMRIACPDCKKPRVLRLSGAIAITRAKNRACALCAKRAKKVA